MNMHPTPLISLSLPVHIGFMIISLIVLLLCYKAKKQLHQLLLLAAILSSGLIYFVQPGISFYILAFEEIALFVANRLSPLDGVMSTATHFILKKYKEQGVFFTEAPKDDRGIFSF